MIRNYRFRRLIAPAGNVSRFFGLFLVGFIVLLFGFALSFKRMIKPMFEFFAGGLASFLGQFVGPDEIDTFMHYVGGAFLFGGAVLTIFASRRLINHIVETLNPGMKSGKADVYVRRLQLAEGPHIVAIGGGTGLSTLLRGLKQHTSNITAIVTVTDDGGSSGQLAKDKGLIPPGDIRNCLVALADAEKAMTDLFQHRFKDSGALSGHSMGNLLIAALVDQAHGDFEKAIQISSDVLAIRGQVMPSTLDHVGLTAELEDGTEISGETAIVQAGKKIKKIVLNPSSPKAYPAALEAIEDADLIVVGPGSVYTSVIPNLLVPGVADSITKANALKVYICNVMTQPGESDSFTASEHVSAIVSNVPQRVFDYVLVNNGTPSQASLEKYQEYGQMQVEPDVDRIKTLGFHPIAADLMNESDYVRHDPMKVAQRLLNLLEKR